VKIGKAVAQHHGELFCAFRSVHFSHWYVIDEIGGENLVGNSQLALTLNLLKHTSCDFFVPI
jgi:hypothetical protein